LIFGQRTRYQQVFCPQIARQRSCRTYGQCFHSIFANFTTTNVRFESFADNERGSKTRCVGRFCMFMATHQDVTCVGKLPWRRFPNVGRKALRSFPHLGHIIYSEGNVDIFCADLRYPNRFQCARTARDQVCDFIQTQCFTPTACPPNQAPYTPTHVVFPL
jgi:hypothetical protein